MNSIQTEDAPEAIGPYSQATVNKGVLYTSGQIGIDPGTGNLVSADIKDQTEQIFHNLDAILQEVDSSLQKVFKTHLYLTDLNHYDTVNEVYQDVFSPPYPARTCVEVASLPANANVEIDCFASID